MSDTVWLHKKPNKEPDKKANKRKNYSQLSLLLIFSALESILFRNTSFWNLWQLLANSPDLKSPCIHIVKWSFDITVTFKYIQ